MCHARKKIRVSDNLLWAWKGVHMSVPKYDELMKPLLLAVQDGRIYKIKDVTTTLAQQFKLSEEDIAMMLPSGRQTVFKNRVG